MSGDAERKRQAAVAMLEVGWQVHCLSCCLSCGCVLKPTVLPGSPCTRTGGRQSRSMLLNASRCSTWRQRSGPLDPQLKPWLAASLEGLQGGLRCSSSELVIYMANMVSQGVMSAPKIQFLVQALQAGAANHPASFLGIVILPNRAADPRKTLDHIIVC